MKGKGFRESPVYGIIILLGLVTIIIAAGWLTGIVQDIAVNIGASLIVTTIIYFILNYYSPHIKADTHQAPEKTAEDVKAESLPKNLNNSLKQRLDVSRPKSSARSFPERAKRKK